MAIPPATPLAESPVIILTCPDETPDSPLLIITPPDVLPEADPMEREPLTEPEPLTTLTDPPMPVPEVLPAVIDTEPPSAFADVDPPATDNTAPMVLLLLPGAKETDPALPLTEFPLDTTTSPLEPEEAAPEPNFTYPDREASAEETSTVPLLAAAELPEETLIEPPEDVSLKPAFRTIRPPLTPAVPAVKSTSPPRAAASPARNKSAPEFPTAAFPDDKVRDPLVAPE